MLKIFIETVWFILPGGIANMAPIFAAKLLPRLDAPVDFGMKLRGIRVFGEHKTVRGLIAGTLAGGAVFLFQQNALSIFPSLGRIPIPDYSQYQSWLGFWLGFCALLGDMVKSFFKRRVGIPPGSSWIPFDQIDWMIGISLGGWFFFNLAWLHVAFGLGLAFVLSLMIRAIGYVIRLNSTPI